ncbi:MAG TPA: SIMPL domain-containing protein [Halanaerobiales bacterium]|nr:SIMPL domain-containing protein [Halanaerobiales bacterium]
MNNKLLYSMLIILVIMFGFLFITNQNTLNSQDETLKSTINLSAQEEMEFSPDKVKIILGVETRSEKLEIAKNENNKKINEIKNILTKYDQLEIANISFNIYPVYEKEEEQQKIQYYKIRNMLEIKSYNLELISKIIDDSLKVGANTIYNLQYSLENEVKAREKVIEKALFSLENKVKYIKDNLNKNEYELINLTVNDNLQGSTLYFNNMKTSINESSINSTNIDPSKIKISVNLRGEYILSE